MYRTFIKLSEQEHLFLRQLQAVVRKTTGKKAPLSNVIQGVIRDYKQTLEQGADPDFLNVYRRMARRSGKVSKNNGLRRPLGGRRNPT